MTPQAGMTSEAHMSPQADIVIFQADVLSQADIISRAGTRTKLTRPCCFYLLSMNPQAGMTSEANTSPQADIVAAHSELVILRLTY